MKKLLLVIFLSSSNFIFGQEGINFNTSSTWQELLSASESANKLIFLDCYTTWCGPCKGMATEVFTDKKVGDFMNENFICTKRDMEKGEGIELNKKFKSYIPGYPTYLLFNSKGDVVYQVSGYMKSDKFIQAMKDGLSEKFWTIYQKKYDSGERSWEFIKEFLDLLETAYQSSLLEKVKSNSLSNLSFSDILDNQSAYDIFRKYWKDVTSPVFKQFMSSPNIYRKHKDSEGEVNAWAGKLYDQKIKTLCDSLTKSGIKSYDVNAAMEILSDVRKSYIKDREEQIARILLYNSIAQNNLKDFFVIIESAQNFGLMRNFSSTISVLCLTFFKDTNDKEIISKCLEFTKVDFNSKLLSPALIRNYAFFVEKSGQKEEAVEIYKKADTTEKELKEKFGDLFKKM